MLSVYFSLSLCVLRKNLEFVMEVAYWGCNCVKCLINLVQIYNPEALYKVDRNGILLQPSSVTDFMTS